MIKKVLIYHTALSKEPTQDDLDVLNEVDFISNILKKEGYNVKQMPFNLEFLEDGTPNYTPLIKEIKEINPSFIFNLVESIGGRDSLAYYAPALFKKINIPYTGCTKDSFYKTESKTKTKSILYNKGILTPYWLTLNNIRKIGTKGKKFLIKSKINHASKDLGTSLLESKDQILETLNEKGNEFFAEEYIEGREFNISMIGPLKQGNVLPIAEIKFINWSPDKLKIVDYAAKWDEDSPEYKNTKRSFEFQNSDKDLLKKLEQICKRCWKIFDLRGYARIDFRVDKNNKPYVLEINTNPCISPDAGFIAAAHKAGMTNQQIIKNIIKNSC